MVSFSGQGAGEPQPLTLSVFKKLNDFCEKPKPNNCDADRRYNPAYRIISDLIEHCTGLLGDLIDRYCHVITSPDYRSIIVGAD